VGAAVDVGGAVGETAAAVAAARAVTTVGRSSIDTGVGPARRATVGATSGVGVVVGEAVAVGTGCGSRHTGGIVRAG
jgi:hypothetical protein